MTSEAEFSSYLFPITWLAHIECNTTILKERPFRGPSCSALTQTPENDAPTALQGAGTSLRDHSLVCKSPLHPLPLFLTYVNCHVWSPVPLPATTTKLPSRDIHGLVILVSLLRGGEGREDRGYYSFRSQNSSWLDFWITDTCLFPKMYYFYILNIWVAFLLLLLLLLYNILD